MGLQGRDTDVVFLSGKRMGLRTFGGSLKDLTAMDLRVFASRAEQRFLAAEHASEMSPGRGRSFTRREFYDVIRGLTSPAHPWPSGLRVS